jgi:hypothetical protein
LNNNYNDILFCEDDENYNININFNKLPKYNRSNWFNTYFQQNIKLIVENCKNEKFLQKFIFIHIKMVSDNEIIKNILKFSFFKYNKKSKLC